MRAHVRAFQDRATTPPAETIKCLPPLRCGRADLDLPDRFAPRGPAHWGAGPSLSGCAVADSLRTSHEGTPAAGASDPCSSPLRRPGRRPGRCERRAGVPLRGS
eukprot:358267-Chlamydomonas_euryale.AAC.3